MERGVPRPRVRRGHLALPAISAVLAMGLALATSAQAASTPTRPKRHAPPPVVATGQPAPTSMNNATAVTCVSDERCWAVGLGTGSTAAIDATTDGGKTWKAQVVPTTMTVLASVSCSDQHHCMAVGLAGAGGGVVSTADGGATWTLDPDPAGAAAITAVECSSKRRCMVLATDGMSYWAAISTDNGATWVRAGTLPAGLSAPGAINCPSPVLCLVAGYTPTGPGRGSGLIAGTSDGGATWNAATLPPGVGVLRSVTCSGLACLAAGTSSTTTTGAVPGSGQLLSSTDDGATWQVVGASMPRDDAFSASCPSAQVCVVVGVDWVGTTTPIPTGSVVASTNGGASWRAATLRYVPVGLDSVVCPAVDRCFAGGGNDLVGISLAVALPVPKPRVVPRTRAPVR